MLSGKDYSNMTLEELVAEEKKLSSQKIMTSVFIGFLVGIAVYSAAHRGLILPVLLMVSAIWIGRRHSQNLKRIQEEISRRA